MKGTIGLWISHCPKFKKSKVTLGGESNLPASHFVDVTTSWFRGFSENLHRLHYFTILYKFADGSQRVLYLFVVGGINSSHREQCHLVTNLNALKLVRGYSLLRQRLGPKSCPSRPPLLGQQLLDQRTHRRGTWRSC